MNEITPVAVMPAPPSAPDSPSSAFGSTTGGLARIGRLMRKELTEILRDRRTILTLVLMPLLLYPLLTFAFQQYLLSFQVSNDLKLGFVSDEQYELLHKLLLNQALNDYKKAALVRAEDNPPGKKLPPTWTFKHGLTKDLEKAVRAGEFDVGIRLRNVEEIHRIRAAPLDVEMIFTPESAAAQDVVAFLQRSVAARNRVELEKTIPFRERIAAARRERFKLVIAGAGLVVAPMGQDPMLAIPGVLFKPEPPPPRFRLVRLQSKMLEPEPGVGKTISLAALVPFILILMTITGAVYPAIDLTAGERERGTLEILVAAPVPRLGLLFAKYVAVLTVAVMTALINLTAMFLTLRFSGWGQLLLGDRDLPLLWVLAVLGLLILFAAFFSAVLLIITSFARSFKEAQAYLIPLMLASLGPGLAGVIPKLSLDGPLAVTPLVNIVLLARDIFEGGADPLAVFLVVGSTLLYSAAAIALAARIFGAEQVLYNEQAGWSDLFRRPRQIRPVSSVSGALLCVAAMVPAYFLIQAVFQNLGEPTAASVITALSLGSLLFAVIPGLAAYLGRVDLRSGFSLQMPSWPAVLGGLILGISLWPFVLQLLSYLVQESPTLKSLAQRVSQLRQEAGLWLALPTALAAVCEELFFRGYLFSALLRSADRRDTPVQDVPPLRIAWGVIVLTAVLFGLMHCLVLGSFAQMLPATFLGLVLGFVRWHTGSVFPGMALHLVHNVILIAIFTPIHNELLIAILRPVTDPKHVPVEWLVRGAVGVPLGALLVWWGGKKGMGR